MAAGTVGRARTGRARWATSLAGSAAAFMRRRCRHRATLRRFLFSEGAAIVSLGEQAPAHGDVEQAAGAPLPHRAGGRGPAGPRPAVRVPVRQVLGGRFSQALPLHFRRDAPGRGTPPTQAVAGGEDGGGAEASACGAQPGRVEARARAGLAAGREGRAGPAGPGKGGGGQGQEALLREKVGAAAAGAGGEVQGAQVDGEAGQGAGQAPPAQRRQGSPLHALHAPTHRVRAGAKLHALHAPTHRVRAGAGGRDARTRRPLRLVTLVLLQLPVALPLLPLALSRCNPGLFKAMAPSGY